MTWVQIGLAALGWLQGLLVGIFLGALVAYVRDARKYDKALQDDMNEALLFHRLEREYEWDDE